MISWLESTIGAQSQSWTSSASVSRAASADVNSVARTDKNSFTYFANFSRTSTSVIERATVQPDGEAASFSAFDQSGQTVITNTNSFFASDYFAGTVRTSYQENSSILSTRSITTSTTAAYSLNIRTTETTTRSVAQWTTSQSDTNEPLSFYTISQTAANTRTAPTATTWTRDTTTTNGETEIYHGLDNTIWQCRTSDYLAEVAWTAANNFALSEYAGSALPASSTVTRWTESRNTSTIAATAADIVGAYIDESEAIATFDGLTSEIPYTTTLQQTWQRTTDTGGVFPVATDTVQANRQTTAASTSYLTYYEPTTFTTRIIRGQEDDWAVTTRQSVEWFNSRKTYTTGNGTISWHEFTDVPATRFRTTEYATARPGNQIAAGYAPILLYTPSSNFEDRGTFGTEAAGITMAISAPESAGLTTSKAGAVTRSVFGAVGSALGSRIGAVIDLNLGKTFAKPDGLAVYQHRAAGQTTVFPSTYAIADTASAWIGTLSVSSDSVSATFAPTNTAQNSTATSGLFSTLHAAHTTAITGKTNVIGGQMADGETFYARWGNGVFANLTTTISSTASVESQTASSASSWVEPIVGLVPGTEINSKTVVSYTQLRNATIYPPPTIAP